MTAELPLAAQDAAHARSAACLDVVFNPHAGTGTDPARIAVAFQQHGIAVRLHGDDASQSLDATLDALCAQAPACIVAAGGAGTVNAVAARVAGTPTVMGILPLGTLNHFARDLGLPLPLEAAVEVIARGQRRAVDVGEVNGRVFLNNASIGLYATMVAHREHVRRHLAVGKWPAMVRAVWAALRHPRSFQALVEVDGAPRRWCTPFLFVGNNAYTVQGPALGQRERLDSGLLALYVLHPKGRWGLLWFGLRALLGRLSGPRELDVLQARELRVDGSGDAVRVARDGELGELDLPLHFRGRPGALHVYASAPAPAERER